jgi:putative ATP-dependent endonuclease of OLD family
VSYPLEVSIKAKNYKSFGEVNAGFESFFPINIIIGRNNTGKSALIDLVKFLITGGFDTALGHQGRNPEIQIKKLLTDNELRSVFRGGVSGGYLPGDHFSYARNRWFDKPITYIQRQNSRLFESIDPPFKTDELRQAYAQDLVDNLINPLAGKQFRRILADRDMRAESENSSNDVIENGNGATEMIRKFYNEAKRNRAVIEVNLLNALNEIFNPDSHFSRILVRQLQNGSWEIFLEENKKGLIALSESGSGLKTVILALVNILLVPIYHNQKLEDFIFAFEELENNLHPGLQRRLLTYIRKIALEHKCCFILTSHSNVVIDLFSKDDQAQIIHTTHNGEFASVNRVQTYIQNRGILDDLDVRASDILQSNAIVWVEGPSDRHYFNAWMSFFSEGKLKEGTHYQCVFYGGRLLSHLSAAIDVENEISILRVNRNAILLMDSDKKARATRINDTKKRMKKEIDEIGGYSWITKGKEVENYISLKCFKAEISLEKSVKRSGAI